MDFDVLTNHKMKIKESEKINKYLDLARKLKRINVWILHNCWVIQKSGPKHCIYFYSVWIFV